MQKTDKHIIKSARFYLFCFVVNYLWNWYHGLLFSSIEPIFFLNKSDITGNLFMLTGLHHQLIQSQALRICFDLINLLLPFLLVHAVMKKHRTQVLLALITALFNIVYYYFFSMMSFVSLEVFIAWMLMPLLFMAGSSSGFFYGMHCLRLLFILFFFSAALWKIRGGGIFNIEQMSGILLSQHTTYLSEEQSTWFSSILRFLIGSPTLSYFLFLIAFLAELVFVIGFITRKYDKYLILIFCLFALFNYFLMEINYFTWLPFMACFYFSRYTISESDHLAIPARELLKK